jgi:hypothetical protein
MNVFNEQTQIVPECFRGRIDSAIENSIRESIISVAGADADLARIEGEAGQLRAASPESFTSKTEKALSTLIREQISLLQRRVALLREYQKRLVTLPAELARVTELDREKYEAAANRTLDALVALGFSPLEPAAGGGHLSAPNLSRQVLRQTRLAVEAQQSWSKADFAARVEPEIADTLQQLEALRDRILK